MTTFVLRSDADKWRLIDALLGPDAQPVQGARCEGWPILVVKAEDGIDVMSNGPRLKQLRDAVRRQLAWVKYGSSDLRHLNERDRQSVHLDARYEDDGRRLVIDFTRAANACLDAAAQKRASHRRVEAGTVALR